MDKATELSAINKEIRQNLSESVSNSQRRIELLKDDLELQLHNLIKTYSQEIRNIAIASGVIAPLSLTLLQVDALAIYPPILIFGFVLIILNIALSQYFIYIEVNLEDKRVSNVQVDLILADFSLFKLNETPDEKLPERVLEFGEKNRRIDSALDGLGYSKIAKSKLDLRRRYLKYHSVTSILFMVGLILIVSSLFVEGIFEMLLKAVTILATS